ncbi:4-(cytidine 5'-diphospho)-2-C-methyl-D-erythritol kinase [Brevundimonas sp.]|uniref:4-(cytidine 5'-diphospho)-2-C-methyl-D-erythritol kinase n=1 Tax=Brevundimonas sp. TaxID=1871086 RepID=UPI00356905A4
MAPRTALAPAKVNLFLHVGPVDDGGFHPLASLAAFADVGDSVRVERSDRLSLTVEGPFAAALEDGADNLILRALRALGEVAGVGDPPVSVHLDKRLPIAAGLGGGSSDAGAALKLVRDLLGLDLDDAALAAMAGRLGSDGPLCLFARAAWAEGRGDVLTPEPRLPPLPALLVNPRVPSLTGDVYRAYDAGPAATADRPAEPRDWSPSTVIDWLTAQRNDLELPAVARAPAVGEVLAMLSGLPGARLTRMSGSGATVFALFDTADDTNRAARLVQGARPEWWVRSTTLS